MKVLAILGSLGSGKTTLVNRILLTSLAVRGRTLVVVNDVGIINVDAQRIGAIGEVKALTAGCIGCSDLPAFRSAVLEAKQSAAVDLLIIEPTGIADGWEIRSAVESCGLACHCITLLDVKHYARNLALNTLASQISASDLIWLTWLSESDHQNFLDGTLECLSHIGSIAPGIPIESIPNSSATLSLSLAAVLAEEANILQRVQPESIAGAGHRHHHNHGVHAYSLRLQSDCDFQQLVVAMAPYLSSLIRAKGVVQGREFDFVQGDISLGKLNQTEPFVNFITSQPISAAVFANIAQTIPRLEQTKKEKLRDGSKIPLADTIAAIEWQLGQYPPVIAANGVLRVDCEADVCYQLAKRDGVPHAIWQKALRKFFAWRIEAGRHINVDSSDYDKRRIGINLAWHMHRYPNDLTPALFNAALALKPVRMALEGLSNIKQLGFSDELAEERPELIAEIIEFGKQHESLDHSLICTTIKHCLELSSVNSDWHERWMKIAKMQD